jgi:hypothetical protein
MRFGSRHVAAAFAVIALASAGACSSDLFHGTDWPSRCDRDPDFEGCGTATATGAGGSGTGATTTGTSTSSTGSGGGGGGVGGAGVGGAGGDGGGACLTCKEALGVDMPVLCPMAADYYAALDACMCQISGSCDLDCSASQYCGGDVDPAVSCVPCLQQLCPPQYMACSTN